MRGRRRKREGNHVEEENESGEGLGMGDAFWVIGKNAIGTDGLEVGDILGLVDGVDEDIEAMAVGILNE